MKALGVYSGLLASILLIGLACGGLANSGVTELNVRVTGLPQFICPSSTPRPTLTQLPTATQVRMATPQVYATYAPVCNRSGVAQYQYVCPPHACLAANVTTCSSQWVYPVATPNPPGVWSGGGIGYGPTATSRATHTPWPTPTPYIVTENYAMGADVYVGAAGALQLRLQVNNPRTLSLMGNRQVVVWQVEIENVGSLAYHALPGVQSFVSEINRQGQPQSGMWYASSEAARGAGIVLDARVLDILVIQPGDSVALTLTAFTPVGEVSRIGWILDPYSGGAGQGIVGGNTAVWVNAPDPNQCAGNVARGQRMLPTVSHPRATATPSVTPYIPPYAGAAR